MKHYNRPDVKRDAYKIAESVHAGDMDEVVVPLVLRDVVRANAGSHAHWLHSAGMAYYKYRLKQLRGKP